MIAILPMLIGIQHCNPWWPHFQQSHRDGRISDQSCRIEDLPPRLHITLEDLDQGYWNCSNHKNQNLGNLRIYDVVWLADCCQNRQRRNDLHPQGCIQFAQERILWRYRLWGCQKPINVRREKRSEIQFRDKKEPVCSYIYHVEKTALTLFGNRTGECYVRSEMSFAYLKGIWK